MISAQVQISILLPRIFASDIKRVLLIYVKCADFGGPVTPRDRLALHIRGDLAQEDLIDITVVKQFVAPPRPASFRRGTPATPGSPARPTDASVADRALCRPPGCSPCRSPARNPSPTPGIAGRSAPAACLRSRRASRSSTSPAPSPPDSTSVP